MSRLLWVASLLVVLFPVGVPAQEAEAGEASHEEGLESRHGLALFLGNTHSGSENGFTVGLDYEYRLNRVVGIGALVDYAGKDFRSGIVGVPVFLHPSESWKLQLAPGVEHDNEGDNNFLFRVGVMYVIELRYFGLAPALMVDFVDDEEIFVFGVNFEWGL